MRPFDFAEPTQIAEALGLAAEPGSRLFAGGCELAHAMRRGALDCGKMVSIMRLPGLNDVKAHPKIGLEFGAQVLIRRLASDIWIGKRWAALHEALEQIRPPHIANMGTVVGNICSAEAHYDLATALTAHRAQVRIDNGCDVRKLPVEGIFGPPGKTTLAGGEMVVSIFSPPPASDAGSAFKKIYRTIRYQGDVGKVNAAAYVALDTRKETIVEATLAIGGITNAPQRMLAVEARLAGAEAESSNYAAAADEAVDTLGLSRGSRLFGGVLSEWVRVLVRDVLEQAASRARSRHDPADDAHLAY
ncbi:FAD binding domain-containing protein [Ensifer sp. ENS06]|uniref:FAD binding domain-containing protein n=1 Tax=Ensifer sp. ENS06 TaxID=2769276 RepID=UPI0017829807|nr:FAD binding domain-containing protein [Ensifer sp. ENS06]MBD9627074.1 FAD binding domain-containing protein [Ensifer sp. ENS06]